jgi:hypothetical protein
MTALRYRQPPTVTFTLNQYTPLGWIEEPVHGLGRADDVYRKGKLVRDRQGTRGHLAASCRWDGGAD